MFGSADSLAVSEFKSQICFNDERALWGSAGGIVTQHEALWLKTRLCGSTRGSMTQKEALWHNSRLCGSKRGSMTQHEVVRLNMSHCNHTSGCDLSRSSVTLLHSHSLWVWLHKRLCDYIRCLPLQTYVMCNQTAYMVFLVWYIYQPFAYQINA